MKQKQFMMLAALILILGVLLAACSQANTSKNESSPSTDNAQTAQKEETHVLNGVINRKGEFLVLLTEGGEYQVMELGEGVSLNEFSEGDSVTVTYTGKLGDEAASPVVVSIALLESE